MKKDKKIDKQQVAEILNNITKEYPPEYFPPGDIPKKAKMAFQELINKYPEVIHFVQFLSIYTPGKTPQEMAEEILKTEKVRVISDVGRMGKRGIGKKLKGLQDLDDIFSEPEKIIKRFNVKIDKYELFLLIRSFCYGFDKDSQVMETIREMGYPDEVGKLVGWCVGKLIDAATLFYKELDYDDKRKAKIVMTIFPKDSGLYRSVKSKGKKPTRESIQERVKTFRGYIKGEIPSDEITRDRTFYNIRYFEYLAWAFKGIHFLLGLERKDRKEAVKQKIKKMLQEFLWGDQLEILKSLEDELDPLHQAYKIFLNKRNQDTDQHHP
jgi:hypothetical protein